MADDRPYRVYRGGTHTKPRPDDPQLGVPGAGAERRGPLILPSEAPAPVRPPRPWRRYRRIGLISLGVGIAVLGVWLTIGYLAFQDSMSRAHQRLDRIGGRALLASLAPDGGLLISNPTTILILGYDKTGHSDAIQLVRVDPNRHLVATLSIPRDLRVQIPGFGADKINAAVADGGPALALRTVRAFVGLPINHVAIIDFVGFRALVDAAGGVDITVTNPLISAFGGHMYKFHRGFYHLNGAQALAYARIRKNQVNAADSDVSRGQRQQQVMRALRAKLVSFGTLLDLQNVGSALGDPLATDLSAGDLLSLGWVDQRADRHLTCNLGGTPISIAGVSYLLPSADNVRVVHEFLGDNAPLPVTTTDPFAAACHVPKR